MISYCIISGVRMVIITLVVCAIYSFVMFLLKPLPKEELYTPPLNIRVMKQSFGRCKLVGVHIIKTLERFKTDQPQLLQGDQLVAAMAQKVATLNASMEMTLVVEEKTLEVSTQLRS